MQSDRLRELERRWIETGDLHDEVYKQIKASLRQAENENKRGVVTRVEPGDLTIASVEAGGVEGDPPPSFKTRYAWTVDGTVYHDGHAHTRTHAYEAEYTVSVAKLSGWRITGQRILSQRRLDDDGVDAGPQTVDELLEMLGGDDI